MKKSNLYPAASNGFPVLIGVKALAEITNFSAQNIYSLVSRKKIPFHKIGGNIRFNLKEVMESTIVC
jgi:excisionase family DNA binding protein